MPSHTTLERRKATLSSGSVAVKKRGKSAGKRRTPIRGGGTANRPARASLGEKRRRR